MRLSIYGFFNGSVSKFVEIINELQKEQGKKNNGKN